MTVFKQVSQTLGLVDQTNCVKCTPMNQYCCLGMDEITHLHFSGKSTE